MIIQYRCIKSYQVNKYDDDGFDMEEPYYINEGDIYELDTENTHRIAGGDLHLDLVEDHNGNKDVGGWLETFKEDLEEYFEEVK